MKNELELEIFARSKLKEYVDLCGAVSDEDRLRAVQKMIDVSLFVRGLVAYGKKHRPPE